jgi:hypothetical protein
VHLLADDELIYLQDRITVTVLVVPPAFTTDIALAEAGAEVTGTVTDASGAPLPGVKICAKEGLGYGFGADVFGFAMFCMLISPAWIKKIAYRVFR